MSVSPDKLTPEKTTSLWRAASAFSSMTLLSRIFGLWRDVVLANVFGVGAATDAFWVAFKIPNFMRRLFAEGAFVQAFVPILSDYQTQTHSALRLFIGSVFGVLSVVLLLLTVLGMLAAPLLIHLFAPGFNASPERHLLAVQMLRITFPYILFVALTAFAAAILNSQQRFASAAFAPVILNAVLIVSAWWVAPYFNPPMMALAWGVFVAGVVQLLFLLAFLRNSGLLTWPSFHRHHPGVQRVLKNMIPALVGSSISQINLLVDNMLASFLAVGSISWLYYADRLSQFPLGLFGVAIATVILPHLSKQHVASRRDHFINSMDWAVRLVLLVGLPAAVGLGILAKPLVITLFYHGHFTVHDVMMAARALYAFALGLPAFMLAKVLSTGFYAAQDTHTPMRLGLVVIVCNIILSLLLIMPLAHAGLALATGLSAWFNVGLLTWRLHSLGIYRAKAGWLRFGLQLLFANAALAAGLIYLMSWSDGWLNWHSWQRIVCLAGFIVSAMLGYFICLYLAGWRIQALKR